MPYNVPTYEHTPTGSVWKLIKRRPLTLVESLPSRYLPAQTRRPIPAVFGRDYRHMGG